MKLDMNVLAKYIGRSRLKGILLLEEAMFFIWIIIDKIILAFFLKKILAFVKYCTKT